jgi:hypothetical protein
VLSFSVLIISFRQILKYLLKIEIFSFSNMQESNGKSPHTRQEESINVPDQNIALLRHKGHEVRNTSSPVQTPKLQLFAGEALAKQRGTHQRHKYYDDSIKSKCQG